MILFLSSFNDIDDIYYYRLEDADEIYSTLLTGERYCQSLYCSEGEGTRYFLEGRADSGGGLSTATPGVGEPIGDEFYYGYQSAVEFY